MDIEGFILAGGQSRRMGADKSRLMIADESFVERIARALAPVTISQKVVGGSSDSFETVPDFHPNWGALGGVHGALAVCQANWALVIACDFPFVTTELFARLASFRANFEAVAPIQADGIPQPLCALYRVNPCLQLADTLIKSGERKPVALLQLARTRWVIFDEVSDLVESDRFFENINTPQDYQRIRKKGFNSDDSLGEQ